MFPKIEARLSALLEATLLQGIMQNSPQVRAYIKKLERTSGKYADEVLSFEAPQSMQTMRAISITVVLASLAAFVVTAPTGKHLARYIVYRTKDHPQVTPLPAGLVSRRTRFLPKLSIGAHQQRKRPPLGGLEPTLSTTSLLVLLRGGSRTQLDGLETIRTSIHLGRLTRGLTQGGLASL